MESEDFDNLVEDWMGFDDFEQDELEANYANDGTQLVTFSLDEEMYGIEILKVRELISYTSPSKVPNVPDCIKGVINLRGLIVPVVDLRVKFNLEPGKYDKYSVIIIIQVNRKLIGMTVDSVSDVVFFQMGNMQSIPDLTEEVNTNFVLGMGRIKDNMVTILDTDCMLSEEELGLLPLHSQ